MENKSGTGYDKVYGVGITYPGATESPCYDLWLNILRRVFTIRENGKDSTYDEKNVRIRKSWLTFINFEFWYFNQKITPILGYDNTKMSCEKDMICGEKDIWYGYDTCWMLPERMNILFQTHTRNESGLPRGVIKQADSYAAKLDMGDLGGVVVKDGFSTPEEAEVAYATLLHQYMALLGGVYKNELEPYAYELSQLWWPEGFEDGTRGKPRDPKKYTTKSALPKLAPEGWQRPAGVVKK